MATPAEWVRIPHHIFPSFFLCLLFSRTFAKLGNVLASSCLPAQPTPPRAADRPHETTRFHSSDIHLIRYSNISPGNAKHLKFNWNLTLIRDVLHTNLYTFVNWSLLKMRNISDICCSENENAFYVLVHPLPLSPHERTSKLPSYTHCLSRFFVSSLLPVVYYT